MPARWWRNLRCFMPCGGRPANSSNHLCTGPKSRPKRMSDKDGMAHDHPGRVDNQGASERRLAQIFFCTAENFLRAPSLRFRRKWRPALSEKSSESFESVALDRRSLRAMAAKV